LLGSPCRPQLSDRDADEDQCSRELRGRRSRRPPRRTMLRGKSRLNVEWLGYSPGLLLEHRPLLAGRTPRSHRRNESSLASTLKTLLFFTALMITVPIGLYFTTKSYIFEGALGMSNRDSYFYAAIVAVVAVHVVLALFVYVAWNEGSRQWREGKQD
ncbi:VMA21 isoform 2, partial [Pongo abelii]